MNITNKILLSFFLILMSGLGFSQSVPSYVPTNGLVGWWGFNGNAQDGSGNGNHGTVNGATLTTDRFGNQNAAYLSNANSMNLITGSCSNFPAGNSPRTISIWYNATGLGSGCCKGLFGYGGGGCGNSLILNFENHDVGVGKFEIQGHCQAFRQVMDYPLPANNFWHNVLISYDANLILRFYFNGQLSYTSTPVSLNTNVSGKIFNLIGQVSEDGNSPYYNTLYTPFNGKLDDIGIWNRALTQQEITNLYNAQSGITIPTLTSCLGDTTSVTISHPALTGVANASLRMTYNPDSLTYIGFNSLNPAFNGMTISGGNGVVLMNWGVATNQTIPSGNMVNLRFRVNGSSPVAWDTLTSCEFSDENLNLVSQTYVSGSLTQNTRRFTWNRNICEGQSFSLSGQSYTTPGTYQGRLSGTGGACDTLITLNLNVIPTQTILPAVTTCSNQPYSFNGLSLTSSGTYFDTLINSLGCDSILQLNFTVNPSYNQNQNIVVCSGTSYSFGGQNLTTSGNYSHTYTTANGCDSLVNLNLTIAGGGNQVTIQASSNTNGFCPGTGIRIGLPNAIPNAFYRWKLNGNILAGANSDTLFVTQAGDYQMEIEVSPTCTVVSNTLTIAVLNCNRITGDLRYDNSNQTPLAGVPVHLKTLLGNIVASDTTDSAGVYDMAGYANGNYLLDASVNYTWGGVTSADALLVTRAFNALISMSALRLKAGDVNMNNSTNGSDALLINRRVTGVISSFVAGNFTNNLPSVNALGNPLVANLRVLSTGDVNGSYAALPTAPALVLDTIIAGPGSGTATVRFTSSGSGVFERGICWGTSPNPTVSENKMVVGSGGYGFTRVFSGGMVGNQLQYARAYARTSSGIFYSNEKTFTPLPGQPCPGVSTLSDIDGNIYQGIQIGTQCWTQSNLKVTKYRNGDNIPTGLSNSAWQGTTSGAYAIYNNDPVNDGLYGKLYNHYAVTDTRGLCPTGWHVPTDSEWNVLVKYLDPNADTACVWCSQSSIAGGALKSTAMQPTPGGWNSSNTGATNSSGFTALPGGLRDFNGDFAAMSSSGYWWSSSVLSGSSAWTRLLSNDLSTILRSGISRALGFSVRCCRD